MARRIGVSVETWTTRPKDPTDSWDTGDHWGRIAGVHWVRDEYAGSYRDVETDLKGPVYVVVAGYRTGSTFGSYFEAKVLGAFEAEWEAEDLAAKARSFQGHGEIVPGVYAEWNGYFEMLDSIEVKRLD